MARIIMTGHCANTPTPETDSPEFDNALRVALTDLWAGGEAQFNPITSLLNGHPAGNCSDVSAADVVVCSVFGHHHLTARGTVVGFSVESQHVLGRPDFSIDCRHLPDPTHLRIPPWAMIAFIDADPPYVPTPLDDATTRRFCNSIYSNPACPMRNAFFEALHQRQPVDSLGTLYRNMSDPRLSARLGADWRRSKIDVLGDYRFTIAFENVEMVGYTTEKMIDAWLADSVPIYWGNPAHAVDFPAGSYLSLYEAGSMSRLIDQVLEVEHDPVKYEELRANNPFRTGHAQARLDHHRHELADFVELIRADALQRRSRPPRGVIGSTRDAAQRIRRRSVRRIRGLLVP